MFKVLVTPALILTLMSCTSPPIYSDAAAGLPPCGTFPNCVNSESGVDEQAIKPLSANRSEWQGLIFWIEGQNNWRIDKLQENFLQAVVTTPLMRFRDDVQLLFYPQQDLIHVRSSSRLGISDMGVNRQRVDLLRQQIELLPESHE